MVVEKKPPGLFFGDRYPDVSTTLLPPVPNEMTQSVGSKHVGKVARNSNRICSAEVDKVFLWRWRSSLSFLRVFHMFSTVFLSEVLFQFVVL